jgi:hypothetical protein
MALLERLIGVLSRATEQLEHLEKYAAFWESEENTLLRRQDKIAAEALLLAYLASRVPTQDQRLRQSIEALGDRAQGFIATPRNEALLRRFPQTAATIGVGYVLLSRMGRGKRSVEDLLKRAVQDGFLTLTERSIFRMMDARWTYALLEPGLVPPVEDLAPLSTFGSSPHPIYTMNEDNYALTHAVFYLTDFGNGEPGKMSLQSAFPVLDPFMAWTAVHTDFDLLGEFLMAAVALGQTGTPAFRFGWDLFFKAWDKGDLVGPEFSAARLSELSGQEAEAYAFSENYHTQFVAGILCAVSLTHSSQHAAAQEGQAGTEAPSALASRLGMALRRLQGVMEGRVAMSISLPHREDLVEWAASRLLILFGEQPTSPPLWLQAAMEASDLNREDLTHLLYDVLLIEAAKKYSLVQLSEALAVVTVHPDLVSATFARALGYLLDQQLDDGSIGVTRLLTDRDSSESHEAQALIYAHLVHIADWLSSVESPHSMKQSA